MSMNAGSKSSFISSTLFTSAVFLSYIFYSTDMSSTLWLIFRLVAKNFFRPNLNFFLLFGVLPHEVELQLGFSLKKLAKLFLFLPFFPLFLSRYGLSSWFLARIGAREVTKLVRRCVIFVVKWVTVSKNFIQMLTKD